MSRRSIAGLSRSNIRLITALVVAVFVFIGFLFNADSPSDDHTANKPVDQSGDTAESLEQLEALPVVQLDETLPYDRTAFGSPWTDNHDASMGHNGCKTRDDILARDLEDIAKRDECVVVSGQFIEPYSGQERTFSKEQASKIHIDHIVPLHAAWQLGAYDWSKDKRVRFANDPINLLASDGGLNMSKGDKLADRWMPPNTAYWCVYAESMVTIHTDYQLGVTAPEKQTLQEVLADC